MASPSSASARARANSPASSWARDAIESASISQRRYPRDRSAGSIASTAVRACADFRCSRRQLASCSLARIDVRGARRRSDRSTARSSSRCARSRSCLRISTTARSIRPFAATVSSLASSAWSTAAVASASALVRSPSDAVTVARPMSARMRWEVLRVQAGALAGLPERRSRLLQLVAGREKEPAPQDGFGLPFGVRASLVQTLGVREPLQRLIAAERDGREDAHVQVGGGGPAIDFERPLEAGARVGGHPGRLLGAPEIDPGAGVRRRADGQLTVCGHRRIRFPGRQRVDRVEAQPILGAERRAVHVEQRVLRFALLVQLDVRFGEPRIGRRVAAADGQRFLEGAAGAQVGGVSQVIDAQLIPALGIGRQGGAASGPRPLPYPE